MVYIIKWKKGDTWYTIKTESKTEMLAEVADKTCISDFVKITVKKER